MYPLYSDLADWYPLLTPPDDYIQEAADYRATLTAAIHGPLRRLLELGCGAGHNAVHLKRGLECVLTDLSPAMLEQSRRLNPDCRHLLGDMRSLRLDEQFDAVLIHDAVAYMVTPGDLAAAAATAFAHLRPGGVALFAPDDLADDFEECSESWQFDYPGRSVRVTEWAWDPDPSDSHCTVEYIVMMREDGAVRVSHETHVLGLFTDAQWQTILAAAGFEVTRWDHALEGESYPRFVCRRPA